MEDSLSMSLDEIAQIRANQPKPAKDKGGGNGRKGKGKGGAGGKSPKLSGRSARMKSSSSKPYQKKSRLQGSRRVYVGNLDWSVSWQDLKDHFQECGDVVYADVMTEGGQSGKGRSKGCGIVEFATAEEAQYAIEAMMDTFVAGGERPIFCREDREDKEILGRGKGSKGGKGGGKGRGGGTAGCRVYVGNLDWSVSWQDLKDHFREAGEVKHAEIFTEGGAKGGRSKGCGIVEFFDQRDARRAIQTLTDTTIDGGERPIFVREDRE